MEPRATLSYYNDDDDYDYDDGDSHEGTVKTLERQGYHFVGTQKHTAVKTCFWLRRSIRGEGNCYKGEFYGISAHRCIQMTPSIFCNQMCLHCWRPFEAFTVGIEEKEIPVPLRMPVAWDAPDEIAEGCMKEQRRLISGFKGSEKTSKSAFEEASIPKHAAISLIGEPTLYPYLDELIHEFHSRGMTTFLVTNGTNPAVLRKISPSQLYLSLNAPDEAIYRIVSQADYWSRINESLKEMGRKKGRTRTRTVIRITCIEGLNMVNNEGYADLLKIANPDFIEVKAYMHIGYSRRRLSRESMPEHARVRDFAREIAEALRASGYGYKVIDESEISRVVLISQLRNSD